MRRDQNPPPIKLLSRKELEMVEAAGVEPASERPVAAGLYMRVRSFEFATGFEERRNRRPLVRVVSPSRAGRARGPAC
jgi:hypothetical protein